MNTLNKEFFESLTNFNPDYDANKFSDILDEIKIERENKLDPNKYIQEELDPFLAEFLDTELV